MALIANGRTDADVNQGLADVIEAPSWQADVMGVILSARNDARLVVRGQPHRLRLVELRILKRRKPKQPVPETRMQAFLGDVHLIPEDYLQRPWQFADDRRLLAATGRSGCPRLLFPILLWRQSHPEDATASFGLLDDPFNLCAADLPHVREKRPLVCPRREVVIEEDAVALSAWPLCNGRAIRLPNPPCGIVSWFGKRRSYESSPISGRPSMLPS